MAVSTLQQELILILMHPGIPIIVTRKHTPQHPNTKPASPTLLQRLRDTRSPSLPKPRNTVEPRHQTLDANGPVGASRTRRISSSAAAKRFPKDFFKDENCLHPIKSIRPKHKQCEPIEPCFLDTFSHKNFLCQQEPHPQPQPIEKQEGDTPKFKHKADKNEGRGEGREGRGERLRSKVQQLIQEVPLSKYHTASEYENNKHPLLQIFQPQRHDIPLPLAHCNQQPFGAVPLISNFNVTLGQKVALSFLLKGQKSKRRKEEKENNEGACPESARKEGGLRAEGFRIRKKIPN